jgi:hypothetical protein
MSNATVELMMNRKSIRKYTKEMPSEEVIQAVVKVFLLGHHYYSPYV